MADDDLQEPLQTLPPMLNHVVTETIGEDFARQRRNRHTRRLSLQDVTEVFEVGVSSADVAVAELESWDVRATDNLVVGIHATAHAMGTRVLDLGRSELLTAIVE